MYIHNMAYHSWSAHNRNTRHSALVSRKFSAWMVVVVVVVVSGNYSDHASVSLAVFVINVVIPNIVNLWCTNYITWQVIDHSSPQNAQHYNGFYTKMCMSVVLDREWYRPINKFNPKATRTSARLWKFKYVTANSDSLKSIISPSILNW